MTPEERQLITGLFDRMRSFGTPEKDREAEAIINEAVRSTPDAAYMLVQSVLVQEHALQEAGNRIKDLEEQVRTLAGRGPGARARVRQLPRRPVRRRPAGIAAGRQQRAGRSARAPRRRSAYDQDQQRPWAQGPPQQQAGPGGRRRLPALGHGDGRGRRRRHAGGRRHPRHMGGSANANTNATPQAASAEQAQQDREQDARQDASDTEQAQQDQEQDALQDASDDDSSWGDSGGDLDI